MNRSIITAVAVLGFGGHLALAQHHGHTGAPPAVTDRPTSGDARELVAMPEMMATHMLANMRDHLAAVQEITAALSREDFATAATVAEQRLGMTSLRAHGASHIAGFMPDGMQAAGTAMHRAASRFAIEAQNAGATGDLKPALATLSEVTAACVTCHAGYRVR